MPAKPVKGPFSSFFYARLRSEGIKPRREKNPQGLSRCTWAVSNVRGKWKKDLYFDPAALRNLDHAIRLLPSLKKPLCRVFEYDLEHEKAHVGASQHTSAYTATKIKRIAEKLGKGAKAQLTAEQVANNAMVARILAEKGAKTARSKKGRARLVTALTWSFIAASIRNGEFKQLVKKGKPAGSEKQFQARHELAQQILSQLFPKVPKAVISDALKNFRRVYGRVIDRAIEKRAAREKRKSPRRKK